MNNDNVRRVPVVSDVPVIGLTGGSGSGKTEAARTLAELGAAVVDADEVARRVTDDPAVLSELAAKLGDWVIAPDGRYNRAAVSERAFGDKAFLTLLTELTHKYIIEEIYGRVAALKAEGGHRAIVIDAPIPVEKGFLDLADTVWVVRAGADARLERIVRRDGVVRGKARARLRSQMTDEGYAALADTLIDNDAGLCELRAAVKAAFAALARAADHYNEYEYKGCDIMSEAVYYVDLLFGTEYADEPGSMHIRVLAPKNRTRITALIEVSNTGSIRSNIASIVTVLQRELFDRIGVSARDARESAVFFKVGDGFAHEFDSEYVKLAQRDGVDVFEAAEYVEA